MSWHCGAPQPILMDEEVVRKAVDEQTPQDQAGRITREEGVLINKVLTIRLDFKYILKIDNLWDFKALTRLYLNNNFIEKIAGVDHLVNLRWLNLSFNKIEKIEGLASLRKLELLNLSNNRISSIENIDQLEALTHFLIANNLLEHRDNVLCLRKIKKLFTINLSGNPISKEDDYSLFIAAYFPDLRCLDYRLLSEETKKEASIKYYGGVEKMRQEEMQKQQADDAEQSQRAERQLHTDAFVKFLNGSYLFESMFKNDPEAETLQSVAGVADLFKTFEQEIVELCEQVFEIGLAEHKEREAEVNTFLSGRAKLVTDYQEKASQILIEFEEKHQERTWELQQLSDQDTLQVKVGLCNDAINQLSDNLMSLELMVNKQVDDNIKELDINISEMVCSFTEAVQGIFVQCRELEDKYHRNVGEIALATLEKVASDTVIKDMSSDARWLFTNRNMVTDALATAHDNHLMKINDKETQIVAGVSAWKVSLFKGIQDNELKQNPENLKYIDYLWEQMEEFSLQDL